MLECGSGSVCVCVYVGVHAYGLGWTLRHKSTGSHKTCSKMLYALMRDTSRATLDRTDITKASTRNDATLHRIRLRFTTVFSVDRSRFF